MKILFKGWSHEIEMQVFSGMIRESPDNYLIELFLVFTLPKPVLTMRLANLQVSY
jgi:hypothetical protein